MGNEVWGLYGAAAQAKYKLISEEDAGWNQMIQAVSRLEQRAKYGDTEALNALRELAQSPGLPLTTRIWANAARLMAK